MSHEFLTAISETVCVILGFMIVFRLMQKYAWGPILGTLEERQKSIQAGFEEIERLQADSASERKRYEEKLREIEAEAREQIQKAVAEGQRVAAEIGEKARQESAAMVEGARKKIELETASARKQLRAEVVKLTLAASEKLLREKLTDEKDKQLVGSFLSDLEGKS